MLNGTSSLLEKGQPSNKKTWLVISVLAVIGLSVAVWLVFKLKLQPWLTYHNDSYDYSFKYPRGWFVDETNAEKDFINNIGGTLIISNKQKPLELLESANPQLDLITMIVSVYQINSQTSVDQFFMDKKYLVPLNQTDVSFDGLLGKQFLYVYPKADIEILNIVTILKQGTKMFVFSYNSFKPDKLELPDTVVTIHDEMLRSFQAD